MSTVSFGKEGDIPEGNGDGSSTREDKVLGKFWLYIGY